MRVYIGLLFCILLFLSIPTQAISVYQTQKEKPKGKKIHRKQEKKVRVSKRVEKILRSKFAKFLLKKYLKKVEKKKHQSIKPKLSWDLIEPGLIIIGIGLLATLIWQFTPFLPFTSVIAALCLTFGVILVIIGLFARPY